jgi:hypothetical protein
MFDSLNYRLIGLCVLLLIAGYFLLGQGPYNNHLSWSVAPLILVGVYCALIPIAILAKSKKKPDSTNKK